MNATTSFPTPRLVSNRLISVLAVLVAIASLSFLSPLAFASAGASVPQPVKPKFTQQPASVTIEEGRPATFTAAATGYPVPSFQWFRNGVAINGATTDKLMLAQVKSSDSGTYTVTAWNSSETITSNPATLIVFSANLPLITGQPASVATAEGETVAFEITASSSSELGFRWRKNGVFIAGATTSRLVLESVSAAGAGDYDAVVSNLSGSVISRAAKLTVLSAGSVGLSSSATEIIWHPANATAAVGGDASLTVDAIGSGLTYQWKKNGRPVAGATQAMLSIPRATAGDMGFYSVVVSGTDAAIESKIAIVNVTSGVTSRLGNLSTRGFVPADGALTVGFTLRGAGNKQVLARAVGPTLARFGLEGSLGDPQLQIIRAGATAALISNDDWCTTNGVTGFLLTSNAVGAFALDAGSKDAALLTSLNASSGSSYTARITARDTRSSGIVLAEIYDGDPAGTAGRLAAISTLAFAGSGARTLVPGFTIDGTAPKRLLIRAVGPGLESFGVAGTLASPKLAIIPAGMTLAVATNDGWRGDAALANAFAAAGAFPLDRDSKDAALIVTLPPGGYTVSVSGVGDSTGNTLFEIYDLDP